MIYDKHMQTKPIAFLAFLKHYLTWASQAVITTDVLFGA